MPAWPGVGKGTLIPGETQVAAFPPQSAGLRRRLGHYAICIVGARGSSGSFAPAPADGACMLRVCAGAGKLYVGYLN